MPFEVNWDSINSIQLIWQMNIRTTCNSHHFSDLENYHAKVKIPQILIISIWASWTRLWSARRPRFITSFGTSTSASTFLWGRASTSWPTLSWTSAAWLTPGLSPRSWSWTWSAPWAAPASGSWSWSPTPGRSVFYQSDLPTTQFCSI